MPHQKLHRYFRHGTLPQLRVFAMVAQLGSFTRAGEALHMAQPTVSVHIKKLTQTIGVPLLKRVGRAVRLTDAGQALYDAYEQICATLARAEDQLAVVRDRAVTQRSTGTNVNCSGVMLE
jgi:DNA-binding transcriptional LysR family regulator